MMRMPVWVPRIIGDHFHIDTRRYIGIIHPRPKYELVEKHPEYGRCLVEKHPTGEIRSLLPLPDVHAHGIISLGCWVKPSSFPNTLPWEWVVTNMKVTIVTGMSSGYCRTQWGARRAAKRALDFWRKLGYIVNYEGTQQQCQH